MAARVLYKPSAGDACGLWPVPHTRTLTHTCTHTRALDEQRDLGGGSGRWKVEETTHAWPPGVILR